MSSSRPRSLLYAIPRLTLVAFVFAIMIARALFVITDSPSPSPTVVPTRTSSVDLETDAVIKSQPACPPPLHLGLDPIKAELICSEQAFTPMSDTRTSANRP